MSYEKNQTAVQWLSSSCKQLFREWLSYKRGKAYETMSKVIMGNGSFYGCLIEPQGVLARWNEKAQTRVFFLSRFLLLNHLESSEAKLSLPVKPIDIVVYAFTVCGTAFVESVVHLGGIFSYSSLNTNTHNVKLLK